VIALRATARLQFHKDFTLDHAVDLVPYLHRLGISHIYASPLLKSRPGSTHGYDIVDHRQIDPELGGEPALRRLVTALRQHQMGLILDIVPNHMGVGGADNAWWLDVLEWGRASPYAEFFDIDWDPPDATLRGRLLAPFLGKPYGECLDAGELRLRFDGADGRLFVAYYSHRFPITPRDYAAVLLTAGPPLEEAAREFADIVPSGREAVRRQAEHARAALRAPELRPAIDDALAGYNPEKSDGRQLLHRLLERQHYRLAWWRAAADEINWRRFFDINELAGIRVELPQVFEATHDYLLALYAEGLIDGVRIDHVDGLADPRAYCRKLRRRLDAAATTRPPDLPREPAVLWVEKILAPHERLARDWLTDGTTGYDFMGQVSALLHDPAGEAALTELWTRETGRPAEFEHEVLAARRQILGSALASETLATAAALHRLARRDPTTRDFTLTSIYRGMVEILVHFHVYRIYAGHGGIGEADARQLDWAMAGARRTVRPVDRPVLDLLGRWLAGDGIRAVPAGIRRQEWLRAMVRFQQLSAPTAAKAVEDTAFYRYGRMLSRNEVGSDPAQFTITPAAFHAANRERRRTFPRALLATATHDHKHGEDTRARLAVLSEIPDDWQTALARWTRLNAALKREIDGGPAPDAADELMLYQTVVGAWPLDLAPDDRAGLERYGARLRAWQQKALREAKRHSEWAVPNADYEGACQDFLAQVLDPDRAARVVWELGEFAARIAPAGAIGGLTQTVLRLTCPGVPDLYQGTEFWDLSLVDPDNRRPVDFAARRAALDADADLPALLRAWRDGRIKQFVIARTLALHARNPNLLHAGEYRPLRVEGSRADHIFAFVRAHGGHAVIVAVTRLAAHLPGVAERLVVDGPAWEGTVVLPPRNAVGRAFNNVLSGTVGTIPGRIPAAELLATLPAAVLEVQ
jgi:(1->4)-alpha-D-glucan 1-alpha-D-glucosylmutase